MAQQSAEHFTSFTTKLSKNIARRQLEGQHLLSEYICRPTALYLLNMHYRGELDIDNGKHVLACFETRNYFEWILKQLINSELSQRMLSTSADNTLLDLHNSSYPTQPHSLIANYPICCIFCPVLPMFLKGWCGQPKIFFFFKTPMRRLDCFCPSGYMW